MVLFCPDHNYYYWTMCLFSGNYRSSANGPNTNYDWRFYSKQIEGYSEESVFAWKLDVIFIGWTAATISAACCSMHVVCTSTFIDKKTVNIRVCMCPVIAWNWKFVILFFYFLCFVAYGNPNMWRGGRWHIWNSILNFATWMLLCLRCSCSLMMMWMIVKLVASQLFDRLIFVCIFLSDA